MKPWSQLLCGLPLVNCIELNDMHAFGILILLLSSFLLQEDDADNVFLFYFDLFLGCFLSYQIFFFIIKVRHKLSRHKHRVFRKTEKYSYLSLVALPIFSLNIVI